MEKICQCINSLIPQESVYIESRHGEDLSVYQFSDPTRECIYRESRHEDLSVHQFSDPTRECIYI